MEWTIKELKEMIEGLDDDAKVVVESIVNGEEEYCSDTEDIYTSTDDNSGEKLLVIVPKEISVGGFDDDGIEDFMEYLIKNASVAFEYQDRQLLKGVLERYLK
jgi:hypothetical protein